MAYALKEMVRRETMKGRLKYHLFIIILLQKKKKQNRKVEIPEEVLPSDYNATPETSTAPEDLSSSVTSDQTVDKNIE